MARISHRPGARGARVGALALGATLAIAPPAAAAARPSTLDTLTKLYADGKPDAPIRFVRPKQSEGGYIAKVLLRVRALTSPGGRHTVWKVGTESLYTRNATRLMVLRARYDDEGRAWLDVQLPIRPNGAHGWIPADATLVSHTAWFVRIRLKPRTVSVYHHGHLAKRVDAVVGARRTPTPRGQFAVYEKAKRRSGKDFLGPWALHLTSFSDVLDDYGGGPGRVALHGRGPESRAEADLGEAASHGCIRVNNRPIRWMEKRLGPGTPVRISRR